MLTTTEPRAALWSGTDVLHSKVEKAVGALFAVGESIASRTQRFRHEDEFLSLLSWTESVGASAFHRVATDPRVYHWVCLAFQMVSARRNDSDLPPAAKSYLNALGLSDLEAGFRFHLEQFKIIALSLAWADRSSISFDPVSIHLPLAIPATRWSLDGFAVVQLTGLTNTPTISAIIDGADVELLLGDNSTQWSPGLSIHAAPSMPMSNHELVLQPHTFNVPGLADIPSVVPTGVAYQWAVFEIAQQALQAMSQYDAATHRQFMESMRVIALKPESAGGVVNTSCSRLPGAAVFTTYCHPLVLAEDFIHEFHHNRLFALEEEGDFLVADGIDPIRDEKFYSPWREDPRPFYGLFHAEYVFDRVLEFWLNVVTDKTLDEETLRFSECRVACLRIQLEMTTIQLRTFATFTEFGQRLFDEIESAVFDKSQKIDTLGIDGDVPAWTPMTDGTFSPDLDDSGRQLTVGEVLQRHVERFDTFERCRAAASR